MSKDLPLSVDDISEIRAGEEHHKLLFEPNVNGIAPNRLYRSPELQAYVRRIGMRLAVVSQRPNLPYEFFVIDDARVDIFGTGGGRVYVTTGFLNFVQSEDELAAGLAHEISHIVNLEYAPAKDSKVKKAYDVVLKASEYADDAVGIYGSGARTGLKAVNSVAPKIKKHFSGDQEEQADKHAVYCLARAGYNPAALVVLVGKLARVDVEKVGLFAEYMKGHPPLPQRRDHMIKEASAAARKYRQPVLQPPPIPIQIEPQDSQAPASITPPMESPAPVIPQS